MHTSTPSSSSITRRSAFAAFVFVRNTILIVGISLLLLLLAEGAVRMVLALRGSPARQDTPRSPMYGRSWVPLFNREFNATRAVHWQPYVYFRRGPAYHGTYLNLDSAGRRVTPQPASPAVPSARVFFFGGSTMFGSFQRDDHTIAAEASHRLQGLMEGKGRVDVTNFGEQGWVSTQELIELMLQLRAGNRPDVVVFVDGVNDGFATVQANHAGIPENEQKRVDEFTLGRKLDRTLAGHGLRSDLRALGALTLEGTHHLELTQQLKRLVSHREPTIAPAESLIRDMVRVYGENVRLVEALARAYNFTPIYVWQPTLQGTDKVMTPYEKRLAQIDAENAFDRRLTEVYRGAPTRLDSVIPMIASTRFIDATHAFQGKTLPAFTDPVGHNTEEAVPLIVDAFWPALQIAVRAKVHARLKA
jgi:hypothetical protein